MQHYNHLGIFDFMYLSNLQTLLDSFDCDFIEDNDDVVLFKVISFMLFVSDYEKLPEQLKKEIDSIRPKFEKFKILKLKYLGTAEEKEIIRLLESRDEDINIHNKFELFNFLEKSRNELIVSESFIAELINRNILPMYFLLQHKSVVSSNELLIKTKLLEEPGYIELFIKEYDLADQRKEKRYFPSLTNEEIDNWIIRYLNSEYCNYNFIKGLFLHEDNNQSYTISTKTRLLIKKKLKAFEANILNGDYKVSKNCEVMFEKGLGTEVGKTIETFGFNSRLKISADWIDLNQDYPTLLNNLLYICDLCDDKNRIKDTYNHHNESTIDLALSTRYNRQYGSMTFSYHEGIKQTVFNAYISNLKYHWKIRIEDLYQWFTNVYLKEEFGIDGINITFYSEDCPYQLKAESVFIQIEHLLRQYAVFVENGDFNHELFDSSKKFYKFEAYPSLIVNKYLVIDENSKLLYILDLLFSDQSRLNYINSEKNDDNFILFLTRKNLMVSDFLDYQQGFIKYLLEEGILAENKNKYLKPKSQSLALLLFDLYTVGFLNYSFLDDVQKSYVDEFCAKGWLSKYNGLFCKQESDYLSYYYDNSKFANAEAIRNHYEHGHFSNLPEEKHMENYLVGLRLLGIVIIKINDDLRQKFG